MKLAHLHHKGSLAEPIWHVQLAVLVAIALQLTLNSRLVLGPKFLVAIIETGLLVSLIVVRPGEKGARFHTRRFVAVLLIALISIANIVSLVAVIDALFNGSKVNGHDLIISGAAIYLTNIIIFGLWYWELDSANQSERDFLFPQMAAGNEVSKRPHWEASFLDYLYVSVTNASAFSPTDTMPLTRRAKSLMTVQALTSLATIALVAARAVNILA